ncbi:MAG: hypothetical protein ACHQWH_01710 [Nitrososphaerales archaeon]
MATAYMEIFAVAAAFWVLALDYCGGRRSSRHLSTPYATGALGGEGQREE